TQAHTVTVMGVSRKLDDPAFVLATQNSCEQDGTYPLTEAQMDRFMFKHIVTYPNLSELQIIASITQVAMAETADSACNAEELLIMRQTAKEITVADDVLNYAMKLTLATHPESEVATKTSKKYVRYGASPRAGQALISAAKVRALMHGRFNVANSDINALAKAVLRHRIKPNFEAITEHINSDQIIEDIIQELSGAAPKEKINDQVISFDEEQTNEGTKAKGGLFKRKK